MKSKILFITGLLSLTTGCATAATTITTRNEHRPAKAAVTRQPKVYNETLNPRQLEHPDHLGFGDLDIPHILPATHSVHEPKLQVAVHHHCKAYDDGTFVGMMFSAGMKGQNKNPRS